MNDFEIIQELERATAQGGDAPLTPEGREWSESWRLLASRLETSSSGFDPQRIEEAVRRQVALRRRRRWLGRGLACAAAAVIAIMIAPRFLLEEQSPSSAAPSLASAPIDERPSQAAPPSMNGASDLAWDDGLDGSLFALQEGVDAVSVHLSQGLDSAPSVADQLDELEERILSDKP